MSYLSMILWRLVQLTPVLIGISIISFLLLAATPGDPARLILGPRASDTAVEALRTEWGLNQPILQQYISYMGNLVHGNLGDSIRFRVPVTGLLAQFAPRTLFIVAYTVVLTIPATILLAITAARNAGRWPDQLIRVLSVIGMTFPVFWLALLFARVLGVGLGWFPVSGYGEDFLGHLHHLFLPALSNALWVTPLLTRNLRGALISEMASDYVAASRAKGLSEGYIFRRHILRNSVLPTLNLLGVMIAFLIGGTIVVETVYAVPGMGQLLIKSVVGRDYFVVQGLTLAFALGTICVTLAIDIASAAIDPRVTK